MEIFKDGVKKEVFGIELFDGDANQYEATNADINCRFFFLISISSLPPLRLVVLPRLSVLTICLKGEELS